MCAYGPCPRTAFLWDRPYLHFPHRATGTPPPGGALFCLFSIGYEGIIPLYLADFIKVIIILVFSTT
jgi:hypothetical protein